jgi:hypothetical protein
MPGLFGSSPSTSTINPGSSSTLSPGQQNIQSLLSQFLGQGSSFFNPQYTGQLTAGLTPGQQGTIGQYGSAGAAVGSNIQAGQGGLASAISGLEGVENSGPASFQDYFQKSVVAPNEQVFNQQTLPGIERAFAASPGGGGGGGTDYAQAINNAGQNLNQTLAGAGASAALSEYNTNQSDKLQAGSELGQLSTVPFAQLGSILGAENQVQATNQATDTNAYNAFNTYNQGNSNYASLLNQFLGTKTTTPNDVVAQQGQASGLGALLGGAGSFFGSSGGGQSGAQGLGSLFSSLFGGSGGGAGAASDIGDIASLAAAFV